MTGYDLCTGWGSPNGANLINTLVPRAPTPVITSSAPTILAEGCAPGNGAVDPGETVTVNFTLKNIGGVKTTNLTATLQADSGVLFPSAPQTYGALAAAGGTAARSFSFTASGSCGSNIVATLQLTDGLLNLGTQSFNFSLGKPIVALSQNFDTVTPPSFPSGWTISTYSNATPWITTTAARDTGPNSALGGEPATPGITELLSPIVQVTTPTALLSFRNNYNTEVDPVITDRAYDGGVLEIRIGTSAFADILAAGGTFVTGGYTRTLDATNDNPLAGRAAWAGNSGGFVSTVIALPASAAGQNIQLKWRFGTDTGNFYGGFGWYIDTISLTDGAACCNSSADLAVTQNASPNPAVLGANLDYSISINNVGPQTAYNVALTDLLPPNVTLVSAPPGSTYTNGTVLYTLGTLASGSSSSLTISVMPTTADPVTNVLTVGSVTSDPSMANNTATFTSLVSTSSPPLIVFQPADVLTPSGNTAEFQVTASGPPPLSYQWFFTDLTLIDATNNLLRLSNVQNPQAGPYFVVVNNSQGSVTSAIAHLRLLLPPAIYPPALNTASNMLSVNLASISGGTYVLEYKNSLQESNWTALPPPVTGTGGTITLQDTNGFSLPTRFYRVRAF